MKLVSGKLMAQIDKFTINNIGIPGAVLMENAGKGAFIQFLEDYAPDKNDKFLIICGKGNNGGDGFVISRYLFNNGYKNLNVILLTEPENLKGDAKLNYEIAKNFNIKIEVIIEEKEFKNFMKNNRFDYIFDAILGTGLNSEVRDFYKSIITSINETESVKIAIDIPSGLCSERGIPLGACIKANSTYTFGLKKIGLSTFPGVLFAGEVKVIDISIPENLPYKITNFEIELNDIRKIYKKREKHYHKGNFGHTLVFGGSTGFSGAVIMASKSALKAGCGLVTAIIPEEINDIFEASLPEAMSYPVKIKRFYELDEIVDFINSKDSILIGPGLGKSKDTKNFLFELLENIKIPLVLDADALNILSEDLNYLKSLKIPKILTPHPGEFSRLTRLSIKEIQENRVNLSKEFAKEFNAIIVLKGYRTVITDGYNCYICPKGDSALATGGSGDVLGGIIASLISQKYSLIDSAIFGVYLHGLVGEICSKKFTSETVTACDLIENLHYGFEIIGS